MTQTGLATEAGVSRRWLSDLEAGKESAEVGLVLRTLAALNLMVDAVPLETLPATGIDRVAEQPPVGRGDPGEPAGRTGRAAHPEAELAGQRRPVVSGAHLPIRPLWLCRAYAAPRPCAPARLTLLREYADDRVALLVYLGGLLHDAAGELHILHPQDGPTPGQLFARFLGWAIPRRPTPDSPQRPIGETDTTALTYEGQLDGTDGVGTEAT